MKAQRYNLVWSYSVSYNVATLLHFTWKWFIYTCSQNVNRKTNDETPKKRSKLDFMKKHDYTPIPASGNDEISDDRNMCLLKEEWGKAKQVTEVLKSCLYIPML